MSVEDMSDWALVAMMLATCILSISIEAPLLSAINAGGVGLIIGSKLAPTGRGE